MKRPAWPNARPHAAALDSDPGPEVLSRIASDVRSGMSAVFGDNVQASIDAPVLCTSARDTNAPTRIWRSQISSHADVWCVVDHRSSAALLELVLGGPGAEKPTSLEQSIVTEMIDRLLAPSGPDWEEEFDEQPPARAVWRCNVSISVPKGPNSALSLLTAAAAKPPPRNAPNLVKVPISVTAFVAPVRLPLATLLSCRSGSIIELGCGLETRVELTTGSTRLGAGSLGVVRGSRAVRLDASASEPVA